MHINLGIFWARRRSVLILHRSIGVADRIQAFADGGLGCIGAATGTLAANESPNTRGRRYRAAARAYLIEGPRQRCALENTPGSIGYPPGMPSSSGSWGRGRRSLLPRPRFR